MSGAGGEAPVIGPADAVSVPLVGEARAAWEHAQGLWGVRMHDAELRPGAGDAQGAAAWFTFPPSIAVDPVMLVDDGISGELESVFAHELGHHVLAPSTRVDSFKIVQQMARALAAAGAVPVRPEPAQRLANLWCDLLVNARVAVLQRRRGVPGVDIPEPGAAPGSAPGVVRLMHGLFRSGFDAQSRLWWVYRRAYEHVWGLPAGTMCPVDPPPVPVRPVSAAAAAHVPKPLSEVPEKFREQERELREAQERAARIADELSRITMTTPEFDADRVAGLVRTFASDPVAGALRFGVLTAPYLVEAERAEQSGGGLSGARAIGGSGGNAGGCSSDAAPPTAEELGRVLADRRLHEPVPARDLTSRARTADGEGDVGPGGDGQGAGQGQGFSVAQTLRLYPASVADDVIATWYRTTAAPWVRPFTERRPDRPVADLPGPIELWDAGDELADLDWSATLQAGAVVVPGVTTRRRSRIDDDPEPEEASIELDLYLDSSGSMARPSEGSPAVLAGTILALSVLRGGGRVRVTSFSAAGQVAGGERFSRNPREIVSSLAFFFASGTSFPLDVYGDRYRRLAPPRDGVRRHVVVLSDDGLVSMFGVGNEPFADVARQVREKLTTGTLVLQDRWRRVGPLAEAAGYDVVYLDSMEEAPRVCARLAEVLRG
ncbi:VWA domain-containing protein [Agromyces sp. PvR057]|uniref:VWA domain-containing protein n=1 Tax=Agromyces sp. PvR057 TaxID=3156403 RepID=UPI00339647BC